MICQDCKNQQHKKCRGGTWCDCQHRGSIYVYEEAEFMEVLKAAIKRPGSDA